MPYIKNCLETPVTVQAHGKWFTFKPNEIKMIHNDNLAMFLAQNRGEDGLVDIAEPIMELSKTDPEYIAYIEQKRKEGIEKRINKLDSIRSNLVGSLRYDVELKGIKTDPLTFASKGELAAIKELNTLREFERSQHINVADEVRKALEGTDGPISDTNIGKNDSGRPVAAKSAKS